MKTANYHYKKITPCSHLTCYIKSWKVQVQQNLIAKSNISYLTGKICINK